MSKKKSIGLKIIFMGTSGFAAEILRSMLEAGYNIISVYTKPDKKSGRKHELKESEIKVLAKEHNLSIFQPEKLDEKATEEIKNQKPDLIVVAAYGRIIPKTILDIPGFGALNVHPSLLPKFRGPSPIQNTILEGEKETGTTIMLMNEGVDTGDILNQDKIAIKENETSQELTKKLAKLSAELLLKTMPLWIERKVEPQKQDNSKATLCQLIEKEDGKVLWTDEAKSIYNRYRALYPWPGIFTSWEIDGQLKRIKLNKISVLADSPETKHHLGEVFQLGEKIGVATAKGTILLEEIQMEGKDNVKIEDFLNGYRNFVGSVLK